MAEKKKAKKSVKKGHLTLEAGGTEGITDSAKVSELPSELKRLRLPIITSPSEVELTHRCHRRHILSDIFRHHSFQSPSAQFGTHLHRGSDKWWNLTQLEGKDPLPAIEEATAAAVDDWKVEEGNYHTKDLMVVLISHYCVNAKLQADLPGEWELVHTEKRYVAEIEYQSDVSDTFYLSHQTDRLLQSKKDPLQYAIIDLKSAARLDERWASGMNRSIQQRLYNVLATERLSREQGQEVKIHGIVEGIQKKDGIKMRYTWPSLTWTPGLLSEAINLAIQAAQMDESVIAGMLAQGNEEFKDNFPDFDNPEDVMMVYHHGLELAATQTSFNYMDCTSYYFDCPYMDVCNADPEDRLGILIDRFEHIGQRIV